MDEGVFNAKEMQRHIKVFVKELFGSANLPSIFNRRFYPSKGDIQKLIYRRRQKLLYSLVDQENLLKKVEDWKKENAEDLWFIRTSASIKRPLNEDVKMRNVVSKMKTKLYLWYISLPGRNVYWRDMGMNSHF